MEEEREVYRKHGTEDKPVRIDAQEVLDAIGDGKDIDIEYAHIQGNLDMEDIRESSQLAKTDLGIVLIEQHVGIRLSKVHGNVSFDYSKFKDYANFRGTVFANGAHFAYCTFSKGANFGNCDFRKGASFWGATFYGHVDFMLANFANGVSFVQVLMERPANFAGVYFYRNTVFAGLWNYIIRPLLQPIIKLASFGRVKELPEKTVTDFTWLNTTTVMDGSTNPHLKRYIEDEQWIEAWRQRGGWRGFPFYIWEATCHCGRSFVLWLCWIILIATIFGAVYADYTVPSWMPGPMKSLLVSIDPKVKLSTAGRIPTGFTPYYFSIVTFTTLGFGDIEPEGLAGEIWLALEVVLGYVMLGGLISIFANKFARRS